MDTPQQIQLALIRQASFNNFDGEAVAADLEANRHLWNACLMTRLESLIQLRDLDSGYWNVDTLFVLVKNPEHKTELKEMADTWGADHVFWLNADQAGRLLGQYPPSGSVLRVWWD